MSKDTAPPLAALSPTPPPRTDAEVSPASRGLPAVLSGLQSTIASLPRPPSLTALRGGNKLPPERFGFPDEELLESAKCYFYHSNSFRRKWGKIYVLSGHVVFRTSALHVLTEEKLVWDIPEDILGRPELLIDRPGFSVVVRHGGAGRNAVLAQLDWDAEDAPGSAERPGRSQTASSVTSQSASTLERTLTQRTNTGSAAASLPVSTLERVGVATAGTRTRTATGSSVVSVQSTDDGVSDAGSRQALQSYSARPGSPPRPAPLISPGERRKYVFVFNSSNARDRCYAALLFLLGFAPESEVSPNSRPASPSVAAADVPRSQTPPPADDAGDQDERTSPSAGRAIEPGKMRAGSWTLSQTIPALSSSLQKMFTVSSSPKTGASPLNPPPPSIVLVPTPQRITILTVGSRGDVQPFIALGKRLKAEGNRVAIASHPEFAKWITSHGLKFREVKGDPGMIMSVMVENGHSTYAFVREANARLRPWLTDLMMSGFEACQGSDVILAGPSAIIGPHVAEALGIPFMFVFTMPWTRTRAFPHPFMVPATDLGGLYNEFSYSVVERAIYVALLLTLNKWRRNVLGIPPTTLAGPVDPSTVPTLYCYSPSVLPKPPDWSEHIHVCGYWFLKNPDVGWQPPPDLAAFLERRSPADKVIYVGFGSIVVPDPKGLTRTVVEAVRRAKVRVVLSKGWSARKGKEKDEDAEEEEKLPPDSIYLVSSIPHDWLFPQMDAVVHHGGAGTLAAGLREGKPTVVCPFFGDQNFWGHIVEGLGVGVEVKKLNASNLASALLAVTTDADMQARAEELGRKIRSEDGLSTAVEAFWTELPRARKIIEDLRDQHEYANDFALRDPTRSFMGDDPEMDRDWPPDEDGSGRRRSFRDFIDFGPFRRDSSPPPKSRTPSPTRTQSSLRTAVDSPVLEGTSRAGSGGLVPLAVPGITPLRPGMRRTSLSAPSLNFTAKASDLAASPEGPPRSSTDSEPSSGTPAEGSKLEASPER
ncbi:hypothetical protein DFJ74DRAFT_365924 [Hyaloraphidium curvatum]|nr:hypothetical protein DFJ74DRAFT_365924 [Hyaloraphidium curvatum]